MNSKINKILVILVYLLSPIVVSIIYCFEEPIQITIQDFLIRLIHYIASILGIFSYIWMCLNIIIMVKIKMIEKNLPLDWLIKFHIFIASLALIFGSLHIPLLILSGTYTDMQINSGIIGWIIIIVLMMMAIIFMTNRLIEIKIVRRLRLIACKIKFRYNVNKILHNFSVFAVLIIFIHSLLSYTSANSIVMRIVYFFFFIIMIVGWISHKFVRRMRSDNDPYLYRKVPWDNETFKIFEKLNNKWTIKLIKNFPSLYTCIQCGICTGVCPISKSSNGKFNPRKIIRCLILGLKKKLLNEIQLVWRCKQCNSCRKNCPQHIEIPEIIIYLRKLLTHLNQRGRIGVTSRSNKIRMSSR